MTTTPSVSPAIAPVQTDLDRRAEQVANVKAALHREASYDERVGLFMGLDRDLGARCFELITRCIGGNKPFQGDALVTGGKEFIRDPTTLLKTLTAEGRELSIIDHLLYEARGGVSLDEMVNEMGTELFPRPVATLVAKYAMERFEESFFDAKQWQELLSAIPVNSEGRQEYPQPPEELYVFLNSRLRPGERLGGSTCVVTYIPQYVKKDGRVIAMTPRNISWKFGSVDTYPNPALFQEQQDLDHTQPSCYSVMEREVNPRTQVLNPDVLQGQIAKMNNGCEMPRLRNAMAAVFCHARLQKILFGLGSYIYCQSTAKDEPFLALGNSDHRDASLCFRHPNFVSGTIGAVASRTFQPNFEQSEKQ